VSGKPVLRREELKETRGRLLQRLGKRLDPLAVALSRLKEASIDAFEPRTKSESPHAADHIDGSPSIWSSPGFVDT